MRKLELLLERLPNAAGEAPALQGVFPSGERGSGGRVSRPPTPVDERVPFHHSPESPGRCDGYQSNLVSAENHSLSQEHDKRQAAALALALAVQRVLESNHASSWTFVAPAQWKNEILSFTPSEIRNHLLDSTEGDWTKFPTQKLSPDCWDSERFRVLGCS